MRNSRSLPLRLLGAALLVSVAACGGGGGSSSGFESSSGTASSSGAPSSSGDISSSSGASGAASDGCSDAAKLVYVVSNENDLYSFKPDTLQFTRIGALNCRAGGLATPNSMAVDRTGTAWVNYSDGSLFKVSTKDATCQSTPFQPLQHQFERFGMAFSANGPGAKEETLFVVGITGTTGSANDGQGLGKIDLGTFKLDLVGDFSGSLRRKGAELTGTGDGKLYGFYTTVPANLAEIAKDTAATPSPRTLTGVQTGSAWAFSFWGGDFWFYTAAAGETSKVTRLKTATDNSISVVKSNLGFMIVGAGVSTCAPTTPPK